MRYRTRIIGLALLLMWLSTAGGTDAASEDKVTLMLGGKFCEMYLGEVDRVLKQVPGVKAVDLKSMKGHAIVKTESGKVKPAQLTDAVKQLKGEGWHCTAEVMK